MLSLYLSLHSFMLLSIRTLNSSAYIFECNFRYRFFLLFHDYIYASSVKYCGEGISSAELTSNNHLFIERELKKYILKIFFLKRNAMWWYLYCFPYLVAHAEKELTNRIRIYSSASLRIRNGSHKYSLQFALTTTSNQAVAQHDELISKYSKTSYPPWRIPVFLSCYSTVTFSKYPSHSITSSCGLRAEQQCNISEVF